MHRALYSLVAMRAACPSAATCACAHCRCRCLGCLAATVCAIVTVPPATVAVLLVVGLVIIIPLVVVVVAVLTAAVTTLARRVVSCSCTGGGLCRCTRAPQPTNNTRVNTRNAARTDAALNCLPPSAGASTTGFRVASKVGQVATLTGARLPRRSGVAAAASPHMHRTQTVARTLSCEAFKHGEVLLDEAVVWLQRQDCSAVRTATRTHARTDTGVRW